MSVTAVTVFVFGVVAVIASSFVLNALDNSIVRGVAGSVEVVGHNGCCTALLAATSTSASPSLNY
jgi:hypothetical protein